MSFDLRWPYRILACLTNDDLPFAQMLEIIACHGVFHNDRSGLGRPQHLMDDVTSRLLVTTSRTAHIDLYYNLVILLIDNDVFLQRPIFRLERNPIGTLA